ncbi:MAG: ABC transporter permease [Candidatus Scalindua sp.]
MFIKNLYDNRELLFQLTLRQIKSRYKQSVLGVFWALIKPFGMMIVFTIIFSKFVKVPSDGIPYPIFSYCALLPWMFFSASLTAGISSMTGSVNLIQQIYFPREIFPISAVMASFVDFGIASVIFVGLMIFYKIQITLFVLWLIPIILLQIVFTIAVSMLGSALNVFYRDIGQIMVFVTQLWMYACPIIYPVSIVPEKYRMFYALNPMVGIIDGYRKVIIQGVPPNWEYLLISFIITILTFFCSYKIFKRLEMRFADVI